LTRVVQQGWFDSEYAEKLSWGQCVYKSLRLYLTTNQFKSAEAQDLRIAEEVTVRTSTGIGISGIMEADIPSSISIIVMTMQRKRPW
jgi:hypothetical protein